MTRFSNLKFYHFSVCLSVYLIAIYLISSLFTFSANAETVIKPVPKPVHDIKPVHGISMHGKPLHDNNFKHYNFVNPNAPKAGRITFRINRVIDSFNPFSIKGNVAPELTFWVFETLLDRSYDEGFTLYARIARSVEIPPNRKWIVFNIDPKARFSDGTPLSAEDVLFSYQILKEKGKPGQRNSYGKVSKATIINKYRIRFEFDFANDRELPLLLGLMPILPKHIYQNRDISKSSPALPVASGPYIVSKPKNSRFIEYKRNPDYWGWHLPVVKGRYNFDTIRFKVYTDDTVAIEALLAGEYDMRFVSSASELNNRYTDKIPAIRQKKIIKHGFKHQLPAGMRALVMNTRKNIFKDINLRIALNYIFDFETINDVLFDNVYRRTQGFFDGSILSSSGKKPLEAEKKLLEKKYFGQNSNNNIKLLDKNYLLPISGDPFSARKNLRKALKLLKKAGYKIEKNIMVNKKTKKPLEFELLLREGQRELHKVALYFQRNLEKLGIRMDIKVIDTALYQQRINSYDFDMIYYFWYASLSPGNEQRLYWHSEGYETKGTRNYMGARNPAIDAMIESILIARNKGDFIAAVRAMDRLLRANFYLIPLYNLDKHFVILSSKIGFPKKSSIYGLRPETWWEKN